MNSLFIPAIHFTLTVKYIRYFRLRFVCINTQIFQSLKPHIFTSSICYYFVAHRYTICYNIVA